MSEKITAIYVMARVDELKPEDGGSYERPLREQEEECRRFLAEKLGPEAADAAQVYRNRSHLLKDVENDRVRRLVLESVDRLGVVPGDVEGVLFEMKMRSVEVLAASE